MLQRLTKSLQLLKYIKEIKFDSIIDSIIGNNSLKDCFPEISLYKMIPPFSKKEQLAQITGLILTKNKANHLLPYSQKVLDKYFDISFDQ